MEDKRLFGIIAKDDGGFDLAHVSSVNKQGAKEKYKEGIDTLGKSMRVIKIIDLSVFDRVLEEAGELSYYYKLIKES